MNLKGILLRPNRQALGAKNLSLPKPLRTEVVCINLSARFDDKSKMPTREELCAILGRVRAAHSLGTLNRLGDRDWGRAIWGIWDPAYRLGELKGFWSDFGVFIAASKSRRHLKNLIFAYLRDFNETDAGISTAATYIRQFLSQPEQADWVWTGRQVRFELFEPCKAPNRLAAQVLGSTGNLEAAIEDTGCVGIAACGGMESAAYRVALRNVHDGLERKPDMQMLNRLLLWSSKAGKLRFEAHKAALAESLLRPWLGKEPEADVQALILKFLLQHLGDLRIIKHNWIGVADADRQVIRRWLTQASLDQFIQVVSRVAEESHWKYRKAFWKSYHDRGYIQEAWVLFGAEARHLIYRAAEEITGYGTLRGGQSNHCVLMLQIGTLTIADWSHNGSCRIWMAEHKKAPQLYQNYRSEELRANPDFEQAHHGSYQHTWQDNIARYIRDKTGVSVTRSERTPS